MGEILARIVEAAFDTKPLFLHGGVARQKRDEMVEAFQNKKHVKIFILSIKAGGTGLNLTAANHWSAGYGQGFPHWAAKECAGTPFHIQRDLWREN